MRKAKVLILENDPSTTNILRIGVHKHVGGELQVAQSPAQATQMLKEQQFDAAIINHVAGVDTFSQCFLLKKAANALLTIVLCAPGKEYRMLEELQNQSDLIDAILDKPVQFAKLHSLISDHLAEKEASQSQVNLKSLSKFLPRPVTEDTLASVNSGDALMAERTVMVTDIRRSTQIISQESLDAYFAKLNLHFTRLGELVSQYRGEVIKYTGDGMLATFSGFGRRQLALKCALAIMESEFNLDTPFEIGIGLNDGLVMTGFIGTPSRLFYDVIGENVNLACRLCERADSNQILVSDSIRKAGAGVGAGFSPAELNLAGFEHPVNCHIVQTRFD